MTDWLPKLPPSTRFVLFFVRVCRSSLSNLTRTPSFHKPPKTLPGSGQVARLYYGQMGAEGNMLRFVESLQGEKMLPGYASLRLIAGIPNFVRPLLGWVLKNVVGNERHASILK